MTPTEGQPVVQTFVPSTDVHESLAQLDTKRLGKQRLECKQILNALSGFSVGYRRHPATRMWQDNAGSLAWYAIQACTEWQTRGYEDALKPWFATLALPVRWTPPAWWGDADVHASHRSNLLRKNPDYYGDLFDEAGTPDDLVYVWPEPVGEDAYSVRVSKPDMKRVALGERTLPPGLAGEPVIRHSKEFAQ